jgi:hypothetical protein
LEISAHFINLPGKSIDNAIEDAQGRICDCLNIDMSVLWQWSDNPVPCKMIITSKTMNSAPQYTLFIKSWKGGVTPDEDSFTLTTPVGAKELSLDALIGFDELPPEAVDGGNQ